MENHMDVISNLIELPVVCVSFSVFLFLFGYLTINGLMDSLLKMHRSKSAVKKIKKAYKFKQKLWLIHYEANCIHAVKFCKCLIRFWRMRCVIFVCYLLVGFVTVLGLYANVIIAWFSFGMFLLFDIPQFVLHLSLSRPFIGRFREFSFEKYHNTKDHDSIL